MTVKQALATALLKGETITTMSATVDFGITNAPRELARLIEEPFGVRVERTWEEGFNRFGSPVKWMRYRLLHTPENQEGLAKMIQWMKDEAKIDLVKQKHISNFVEDF